MLTPGSSVCEVGKLTLFLLQLELFWLLVLLNSYHPNRRLFLPWSYALFSCLLSPSLSKNSADDDHVDKEQENDRVVDRDETDPYNEVIFGRRRPRGISCTGIGSPGEPVGPYS